MSQAIGTLISLILTILVLLKLFDVIDWSWWIILAPAIIGYGLSILFTIIMKIFISIDENKKSS